MMKNKLLHPLWTHLPALAALIILVVYLFNAGPLPAEAPIHFDFSGQPDNYGSPWSVFGLFIGLSAFFIVLSAFLDELWARQEKSKRFNWLSLMDEVVVGAMAGFGLDYLTALQSDFVAFSVPWRTLVLFAGGAALLGIIVEMLRPWRPYAAQPAAKNDTEFEAELQSMLQGDAPFVYWDTQNPFYITLLTVALPLVMLASAILAWFEQPWVAVLLAAVGILLIIPNGGLRTLVTRREITVRFGTPGIRVLRLRTEEITAAELHEFAPLRDFGGYGIRFNREMKAYFMRGTRGVKLTRTDGKKYLIGSDTPERLLAIIRAVMVNGG